MERAAAAAAAVPIAWCGAGVAWDSSNAFAAFDMYGCTQVSPWCTLGSLCRAPGAPWGPHSMLLVHPGALQACYWCTLRPCDMLLVLTGGTKSTPGKAVLLVLSVSPCACPGSEYVIVPWLSLHPLPRCPSCCDAAARCRAFTCSR